MIVRSDFAATKVRLTDQLAGRKGRTQATRHCDPTTAEGITA